MAVQAVLHCAQDARIGRAEEAKLKELHEQLEYVKWLRGQNGNRMRETIHLTRALEKRDLKEQFAAEDQGRTAFLANVRRDEELKPLSIAKDDLERFALERRVDKRNERKHLSEQTKLQSKVDARLRRHRATQQRIVRYRETKASINRVGDGGGYGDGDGDGFESAIANAAADTPSLH